MSTVLPAKHFAVIQDRMLKGEVPSMVITDNGNGTYTMKASFTVTFFPDVPGGDTEIDLKNEQGIDYAGFPKAGGEIGDDVSIFCKFRSQGEGIFFGAQIIKTSALKVNHG